MLALPRTIAHGQLNPAGASAAKVYGSEFNVEAIRLLTEIIGQAGYVKRGSPEAVLQGRLERNYRSASIATTRCLRRSSGTSKSARPPAWSCWRIRPSACSTKRTTPR